MSATLLLADESVTIQRVAELTLAREGIRVIAVADGEEALRLLETERPDIVLVDVGLPTNDGYAVASHIKKSPTLRHVPVLLLIGPFDPIDETQAKEAGCDGVLVKPFESEQLVGCVKDLLAGRRPASLWPVEASQVDAGVEPTVERHPIAVAGPSREKSEGPAEVAPSVPSRELQDWHVAPLAAAPEEPKVETAFDAALEQLDVAFSSAVPPSDLDKATAMDFAKDVDQSRGIDSAALAAYRAEFGDWEVPVPPAPVESAPPPDIPLPKAPPPARPAPMPRREPPSAPPPVRPARTPGAPVQAQPPVTAPLGVPGSAARPSSRQPLGGVLDLPEARKPLFPWQNRPFTVVKLRDVMSLDTRHFARLPKVLTSLEGQWQNRTGVLPQGVKTKIRKGLARPLAECREVGFASSAKCIGRIQDRLDATDCSVEEIAELFADLGRRLEDDAELCTALLIPSSTVNLYRNPQKGWKLILDRFPSLTPEIEEANKCTAVGRYAAAVFHLSRVMDVGLGAIGGSLKLHRKHAPTWTAVLAVIDKKVARPASDRKGPPRSRLEVKEEKFLAKAADCLRAVQRAWRSPDMHEIRHIYDSQAANEVLTSVQAFMRHLATRFHE